MLETMSNLFSEKLLELTIYDSFIIILFILSILLAIVFGLIALSTRVTKINSDLQDQSNSQISTNKNISNQLDIIIDALSENGVVKDENTQAQKFDFSKENKQVANDEVHPEHHAANEVHNEAFLPQDGSQPVISSDNKNDHVSQQQTSVLIPYNPPKFVNVEQQQPVQQVQQPVQQVQQPVEQVQQPVQQVQQPVQQVQQPVQQVQQPVQQVQQPVQQVQQPVQQVQQPVEQVQQYIDPEHHYEQPQTADIELENQKFKPFTPNMKDYSSIIEKIKSKNPEDKISKILQPVSTSNFARPTPKALPQRPSSLGSRPTALSGKKPALPQRPALRGAEGRELPERASLRTAPAAGRARLGSPLRASSLRDKSEEDTATSTSPRLGARPARTVARPTSRIATARPTREGTARPTREGTARPTREGTARPTREGTARPTREARTTARAETARTTARAETARPTREARTTARTATARPTREARTAARSETARPTREARTAARSETARPTREARTTARTATARPTRSAPTRRIGSR